MDDGGLNKPHDAEQANEQVNKWDQRFDVRSPEIWIKRFRHKKRSQSIGNDEANLILKSSHSGIFSQDGEEAEGPPHKLDHYLEISVKVQPSAYAA
jgi:hypothetical protein